MARVRSGPEVGSLKPQFSLQSSVVPLIRMLPIESLSVERKIMTRHPPKRRPNAKKCKNKKNLWTQSTRNSYAKLNSAEKDRKNDVVFSYFFLGCCRKNFACIQFKTPNTKIRMPFLNGLCTGEVYWCPAVCFSWD